LEIRWRYLAAILDCAPESFRKSGTGRMVTESGLPIAEHTYLGTITGLIDGQPWRRDRIH
jgi:hypothetical protein